MMYYMSFFTVGGLVYHNRGKKFFLVPNESYGVVYNSRVSMRKMVLVEIQAI